MATLALQGELTIYSAAVQKQQLLSFIASANELILDLAAVSELDTAGLQLLLLARQTATTAHKRLTLVNHSAPVLEVLRLTKLVQVLGDV